MKVTLHNLDRGLTRAAVEMGRSVLGELPDKDVSALLEKFSHLDDLQCFEADPEILLESPRAKRLVRVSRGRLCLYNPGKLLDAALVLTTEQIIAEMTSTPQPSRTAVEQMAAALPANHPPREPTRPVVLLRRENRIGLATAALGLSAYLFSVSLAGGPARPAERFIPLADRGERDATELKTLGVYMTGNQPGDHGIVLDAGGAMKLFQLNEPAAPLLIRDEYRIGRIDGSLCLIGRQTGDPVWIGPENTLTFCGATYQRIQ